MGLYRSPSIADYGSAIGCPSEFDSKSLQLKTKWIFFHLEENKDF